MKEKTKNPYRSLKLETIKKSKSENVAKIRADKTVGGDLRCKGGK